MSKMPPIPPQQQTSPRGLPRDRLRSAEPDRRDLDADIPASQTDDDVNLEREGRYPAHERPQPRG